VPIHDQGYRHYTGPRALHARGWWVIARHGVLDRLRERRFLALLLFAWSLFVFRASELYIGTTAFGAAFFAPSEETFRTFLGQQRLFVFFITIYAGAGLIATDRQSNALQMYLSRPITRHDYIGGKLLTLALFLAAVTWCPAMLLLALQILFTGSLDFVISHPRLIPAITLASMLQVAVASMMMLALSSLSRSRRFAAMMYAGIVIFAGLLDGALERVSGNPLWVLISPQNTLLLLMNSIFGAPPDDTAVLGLGVAAVAILLAACLFILERRVHAVDVVA
jgi:ABC-2 type transport system permease protein